MAQPTPAAAKTAITPRRDEDFPEWYQQVIRAAAMAEPSDVRGCMVIRPWGYGIWENMQHQLDAMFRATGHRNAYFPLFIPLSYMSAASLQDGGQIVRVQLPRSALANFGFPVNMDRYNEKVKADVLFGVDGTARAIRFVQ